MTARRGSGAKASADWGRLGVEAAQSGDLEAARDFLAKAIATQKRHPGHRLNLAIVEEKRGQVDAAAQLLTEALRLDPSLAHAAVRLSSLLARYEASEPGRLDPHGLRHALAFDRIDRQPLVEAAFAHLKATGALAELAPHGPARDWPSAARAQLVRKTGAPLRDPLLLAALHGGLNTDPEMECLLAALRRVILLELGEDRFHDRALHPFACALIRQCINNEYVFPVSGEEEQRLAQIKIERRALLAGEPAASRDFLLLSLYLPFEQALGSDVASEELAAVRPQALRDLAQSHLAERAEERALAQRIGRVGMIADSVSRKVAAQYEASPYPRWLSLGAPAAGSARRTLERFVDAGRLSFMDGPFTVLIAGTGTGQQAIRSAIAYGDKAHVLAIDLSLPSLAYAARMAARLGVGNIEFAQGDILGLAALDRSFDIIECAGVLHHMAEPLAGWRVLVERLRPGGLMYIGLYSAVSRRNLAALRDDPAYPGPGCSDERARAFRHALLTRQPGEPGSELAASKDFYSLSDFRDLALHESEMPFTLPEIARFLEENGLDFRGFALPAERLADFTAAFPDDPLPGRLDNWRALEQRQPNLFDAMYQFWCEKGLADQSRASTA